MGNDWYLMELLSHYEFIKCQQQTYPKLRGPFLAELYLLESMCSNLSGDELLPSKWPINEDFAGLFTNAPVDVHSSHAATLNEYLGGKIYWDIANRICVYIEQFRPKPCCFADLKRSLELYSAKSSVEQAVVALSAIKNWTSHQANDVWLSVVGLVEADGEVDRTSLVETICCYNTLQHLCLFCGHLSSCTGAQLAAPLECTAEYRAALCRVYFKSKPLLSGGIGGDREVQPGDELLRICLLHLRGEMEKTSGGTESEEKVFADTVRQVHLLRIGCTVSPHNYAFNIDIMEPLRILSAGESALTWFKNLDVKHIQLDSMTYLIVPVLMESGLFAEAQRHVKSLIHFIQSARKDTVENVAKCFSFSNYMKALEMETLDNLLKSSLHAAVGRVELCLLTLVNRCHSFEEARLYLQEVAIGAAIESQEFYTDSSIAELVDNSDYDIMVRSKVTKATAASAKDVRRQELEDRLSIGQYILKILSSVTCGNLSSLQSICAECVAELETSRVKVSDTRRTLFGAIEWSQRIDRGGMEFETCIYNTFFLSVNMILQHRENPQDEKLISLAQEFNDQLAQIKVMMGLSSSSTERSMVLKSAELGSSVPRVGKGKRAAPIHYPLSPKWIRQVSFLSYSLASWVPIILGSILSSTSKKKKVKGKSSAGPDPLASIKSSCLTLVQLLGDILSIISREFTHSCVLIFLICFQLPIYLTRKMLQCAEIVRVNS